MDINGSNDIVIVGAGIAGLATALGLHRKGIRSLVLESSDELRTTGFGMSIWPNAWRALDELGVATEIRNHHIPLLGVIATSQASTTKASFETRDGGERREVRCVRRKFLLEALAKELPHGSIRYSAKIDSVDESGKLMLLHLTDGSTLRAKVLVGCDGVNSVVARWLGLVKPSFSSRSGVRGFAEFPDGHPYLPYFMQYSGQGFRAGLLPFDDKNVYWFFTWTPSAQEKDVEHNAIMMKKFILSKLNESKISEDMIRVVEKSELSGLVSSHLRFRPPFELLWKETSKGNVCVAGDALHPMTPDIGQGGCSALEDAVVLARCLGNAILKQDGDEHDKIRMALKKYASERRWRSFQLITTAYVVGIIQQSDGAFMSFLRDKFLFGVMAQLLLKSAQFDCRKL